MYIYIYIWEYTQILTQYIDGLMQKKRNSIASTMELRLFGIKPSS